jgi:hypothetical protein
MSDVIYAIEESDAKDVILYRSDASQWTEEKKEKCLEYIRQRIKLDWYNAIDKLITAFDEDYEEEQQSNADVKAEEKYQNRKDGCGC